MKKSSVINHLINHLPSRNDQIAKQNHNNNRNQWKSRLRLVFKKPGSSSIYNVSIAPIYNGENKPPSKFYYDASDGELKAKTLSLKQVHQCNKKITLPLHKVYIDELGRPARALLKKTATKKKTKVETKKKKKKKTTTTTTKNK
jgi:hypothetical protein